MATPPPQRPQSRHEFEIALICALRKESDAVLASFHGHWRDHGGEFPKLEGDTNIYWTGWIGPHNVVLIQLPGMGHRNASSAVGSFLPSFPRIRLSLVVGICGGVPGRTKQEMILGDVVISTQIIHLGLASRYPDRLTQDTCEDQGGRPSGEILSFLEQIQGKHGLRRLQAATVKYSRDLCEQDAEEYCYPGAESDKLYEVGYRHKHQGLKECDTCARCEKYDDPVCNTARTSTCSELRCDDTRLVVRNRLKPFLAEPDDGTERVFKRTRIDPTITGPEPLIHFGLVGSGDWVIKSQVHRDSLHSEVIAYEMEGSGVSHTLPALVIKAVCDYADSHKNKDWQRYATGTAAACAKAVLHAWPKVEHTSVHERLLRHDGPSLVDPPPSAKLTGFQDSIDLAKEGIKENRGKFLTSLRFDQISTRQDTIKSAHQDTCQWLFDRPEYQHWLNPQQRAPGFFWIKGKPGAGKSTMMKFLLAKINTEEPLTDRIILSFFFNARGEDLEKTTVGLYRSLLFQVLSHEPNLQDSLDFLPHWKEGYEWKVETLRGILENCVRRSKRKFIMCLIDALDECEEDEVRDLVSFFEHLTVVGATCNFRTCFASRHYPHVSAKDCKEIILENQADHQEDIKNYIESRLRGPRKTAKEMKDEILQRSSGVFLWVYLVVSILNKEYDHGRIHNMERRLREIPNGLDELFQDILTRDTQRVEDLITCLQIVLFARRPLTPKELYHAMIVRTEPESLRPWRMSDTNQEDVLRFILSTSKGLAEETRDGTVQFIHETVRDYFLKENGLQRIWPNLGNNFVGLSNQVLRRYSQFYIEIAGRYCPQLADPGWHKGKVEVSFPFFDYASYNVIFHADAAAKSGINQDDFTEWFSTKSWVRIGQWGRKTPLYIFASENLASLVSSERRRVKSIDIQGGDFGTPLLAAVVDRKEDALSALLAPAPSSTKDATQSWQCHSDDLARQSAVRQLLQNADRIFDWKSIFTGRTTLLIWAIEKGKTDLVRILLNTKQVDINFQDTFRQTALMYAASMGHDTIVQLLLAAETVDVNSKDDAGWTPLSLASVRGYSNVVKLLLETAKVNINSPNSDRRTSLSLAAEKGHTDVVKLLLRTGEANINLPDSNKRTALSFASERGHVIIVVLLLETGKVDINFASSHQRTPLSFASEAGHAGIVKLLLETGKVDINSPNSHKRTPLSFASERGHADVIKLLLGAGESPGLADIFGCTPIAYASGEVSRLFAQWR